ncbi:MULTISPECIES: hypothetical protein [Mycobacterium]|nr:MULTISPECIES: hypothetical protein [Mycobacterium]MDP7732655.1 hypothetical protein [Mycobacterium sp. TY813]
MVETALWRLMVDSTGQVPVPLMEWVVSGEWPSPQLRCDVAFPDQLFTY